MSKKRHRLSGEKLRALTREDGELFHDAKGQPCPLPRPRRRLADTHGHLTHFHQYEPGWALARAALAGVRLLGVPVDPTDDGCPLDALIDGARLACGRAARAGVLDG